MRKITVAVIAGVLAAVVPVASGPAATQPTVLKVWGDDCCGQLGIGQHNNHKTLPVTVPLSGVKAVVGGGTHAVALMDNGTIMAWGNNEMGQLGDGSTKQSNVPVQVKGITNAVAVSTYAWTNLALLADGTVMAWGDGESGELGNGSFHSSDVPVRVTGLSNVKAVYAGQNYSFALLRDGTVMGWGDGSVLGNGPTTQLFDRPIRIARLSGVGVTQIATGTEHAFALLGSGRILAWGANGFGELGTGEHGGQSSPFPVPVDIIHTAVSVAAGYDDGAAVLRNGTVMTWGSNSYGQLGIGDRNVLFSDDPIQVFGVHDAVSVSLGATSDLVLLKTGRMMGWGEDDFGELGNGQDFNPEVPAPVTVKNLGGVTQMSAGGGFGMALVP